MVLKCVLMPCGSELWGTVKPDDCTWEIDEDEKLGRCVILSVKKATGSKWDYLLKSEDVPPNLDVTHKVSRCPGTLVYLFYLSLSVLPFVFLRLVARCRQMSFPFAQYLDAVPPFLYPLIACGCRNDLVARCFYAISSSPFLVA